jgi:type IV pilus assembly protein PilN
MIEINLMPHREARKIAELRQTVALLVLGLILCGGGIFFASTGISGKLERAEISVSQLEAAIEQYKPQQKQVSSFRKKREDLENKLDVISGLEAQRTGPVRLLAEISNLVPERLWLEALSTKGSDVSMEGSSIDTGIVADFLRSLNRSKYFSDIDLKRTQSGKEVDGVKLVNFKIMAKFSIPSVGEDEKKG